MIVIVLVVVGLLLVLASRVIHGSRQTPATGVKRGPSRLRGGASWLLLIVGSLTLLLGVVLGSLRIYLAVQMAALPPIEASVPLGGAALSASEASPPAPVQIASSSGALPSTSTAGDAVTGPLTPARLPPTQIQFPRLGLTWPVALSDFDYELRFRAVGWIVGTTFPGATGNMVFYGQAEGPYATLDRLDQLKPGDEIIISTDSGQYHYRVRSIGQVAEDNVAVVAPTTTAVATLITDVPSDQQQRLVVVADLAP